MAGRLAKEIARYLKDPVPGIEIFPNEENIHTMTATIMGPIDSPYEGGTFKLEIKFPSDYPIRPPSVRFLTTIQHPNVFEAGRICLDILKDQWSPAYQVRTVLLSIRALLSTPHLKDVSAEYQSQAASITKKHATKK